MLKRRVHSYWTVKDSSELSMSKLSVKINRSDSMEGEWSMHIYMHRDVHEIKIFFFFEFK